MIACTNMRAAFQGLYANIEKEPFKFPEDEDGLSFTFVNPERNGWLVKEGIAKTSSERLILGGRSLLLSKSA